MMLVEINCGGLARSTRNHDAVGTLLHMEINQIPKTLKIKLT